MASLIVTSGDQKGEFLPLGKCTSVIGRAENLPLQVLDNLVSRKHLRICFDKATDKYYVEDLRSKHGVSVNNHRITNPTVLTDGDEILIGNVTLLFTDENFGDRESALSHYKEVGERKRSTVDD